MSIDGEQSCDRIQRARQRSLTADSRSVTAGKQEYCSSATVAVTHKLTTVWWQHVLRVNVVVMASCGRSGLSRSRGLRNCGRIVGSVGGAIATILRRQRYMIVIRTRPYKSEQKYPRLQSVSAAMKFAASTLRSRGSELFVQWLVLSPARRRRESAHRAGPGAGGPHRAGIPRRSCRRLPCPTVVRRTMHCPW
ncbi:hypothetical protein ABH903_003149 [Brevibacterium epidermidis]|uniref:Uncharacterized protein n=1 Tax=Brevibacterium epidermidis TaxID=1698 RepID=A0ABV4EPA4_BREEP